MEYDIPFTRDEVSTTRGEANRNKNTILDTSCIIGTNANVSIAQATTDEKVNYIDAQNGYKVKINENVVKMGDLSNLVEPFPKVNSLDIVTSQSRFNSFHGDNRNKVLYSESNGDDLSSRHAGGSDGHLELTPPNGHIEVGQLPSFHDDIVNSQINLLDYDTQSANVRLDDLIVHDASSYQFSNVGSSNARQQEHLNHFETNQDRSYVEGNTLIDKINHTQHCQQFEPSEHSNNIEGKTSIAKRRNPENWQYFEPSERDDYDNYILSQTGMENGRFSDHWVQFEPNEYSGQIRNKQNIDNAKPREDWQNVEQNEVKRHATDNHGIDTENWDTFEPSNDTSYVSGEAVSYNERSQPFEANEDKIDTPLPDLCPGLETGSGKAYFDGSTVSNSSQNKSDRKAKRSVSHLGSKESIDRKSSIRSGQYSHSRHTESRLSDSQISPPSHDGKHRRDTAGRKRSKVSFETEDHADRLGHGLVMNATSLLHNCDQSNVPTSGSNESSIWKHNSANFRDHSKNEQSLVPFSTSINDIHNPFTQRQPQVTRIRPHSVDISVFHNSILFEPTSHPPFNDNSTAAAKRKLFSENYRTPLSSSVPEDSVFNKSYNAQSKSIQIQDTKKIFRTSSSGSLLSDSSLDASTYVSPPRDTYKKPSKLKSIFSNKRAHSVITPLDDAMDFGAHNSSMSSDESQYRDEENIDNEEDYHEEINPSVKPVKEADLEPDAKSEPRTAVYKRRWYLLFLFSVSAMLWNAVWSTWGPIAQSAKLVYSWTDGDIAMFVWLGNIPFLITMFPSAYLMDVSGMRLAMIAACAFMFLGSGFRCIPSDITTASWLIRIGQFLNGMAGTIPNSGPALLSALWFPPNQRASATAISTVAGYMGACISFIIGPLLVPEPNDLSPVNNTDDEASDGFSDAFLDTNNSTNSSAGDYDEKKNGIMSILYAEFGVSGLLLLLVLIYFPSKPPLPPSVSASIPREKYIKGLKMLVRNKQFWVCALAFSIPIGVYEAWQVILDVNLNSSGISQQTAGWLDFYATLGGCVSGLLVSRFADFFTHQMKMFLLVFYFLASAAILWFTLVILDILPFDDISIYAAIIIAGVFLDGGGPLFFELTIEVSYPVGEGVTSGFAQMLCATAGIVFLSVVQVESLGTQWMNWCFFGCVALAIPLLYFINTTYGRADIDDMEIDVPDDEASNDAINSSDKKQLVP